MMRRFLSILLLLSALLVLPVEAVAEEDPTASLYEGILSYQLREAGAEDLDAWIAGALTEEAGRGAEWFVFALAQGTEVDLSSYEAALLRYLDSTTVSAPATRLKYALCLSAVGSTDPYIRMTLAEATEKQGVMSRIFGLHLFNNGYTAEAVSLTETLDALLALRCPDGGWAVRGQAADVDTTAMALQALAPHRERPTVSEAVEEALTFLSLHQLSTGDWAAFGTPNAESTAQVLVTLTALGIDPLTDGHFIKEGTTAFDGLLRYRLPDGSFSHTEGGASSPSATSQVFYTAVAYDRYRAGKGSLYDLDRADPAGAETRPAGDPTDTEKGSAEAPTGREDIPVGKLVVCLCLLAAGGIILLILARNRALKRANVLSVLLAVIALMAFLWLTEFRSPEDYYHGELPQKENAVGTVTFSIRCDEAVGVVTGDHIPADGAILSPVTLPIAKGDTVYTLLMEVARAYRLPVENNGTAAMPYIVGIRHLYEGDGGDLSGWTYLVNGITPSVGAASYALSDGDTVEWVFSLHGADALS